MVEIRWRRWRERRKLIKVKNKKTRENKETANKKEREEKMRGRERVGDGKKGERVGESKETKRRIGGGERGGRGRSRTVGEKKHEMWKERREKELWEKGGAPEFNNSSRTDSWLIRSTPGFRMAVFEFLVTGNSPWLASAGWTFGMSSFNASPWLLRCLLRVCPGETC